MHRQCPEHLLGMASLQPLTQTCANWSSESPEVLLVPPGLARQCLWGPRPPNMTLILQDRQATGHTPAKQAGWSPSLKGGGEKGMREAGKGAAVHTFIHRTKEKLTGL